MERGRTLADVLSLLESRVGTSYDVNIEPKAEDMSAIEIMTPSQMVRFSLEKEFSVVDLPTPQAPTMVLISNSSKRIVTVDVSNPNIIGISYVFNRPLATEKRAHAKKMANKRA